MSFVDATSLVNEYFIAHPADRELIPTELIPKIEGQLYLSAGDTGHKVIPHFTYQQSNLSGYCYFLICDNCSGSCRKAYVKRVCFPKVESYKVLCGKCFGKKYRRMTVRDKRVIDMLVHPEKLSQLNLDNIVSRDALVYIDTVLMRDQLRSRVIDTLESRNMI